MFLMVRVSGQGTRVKGSVAPVLASEFAHSFPGSLADQGQTGSLELHWKKESERSQISQKDFGWRNAETVERRERVEWKSVRNRAD